MSRSRPTPDLSWLAPRRAAIRSAAVAIVLATIGTLSPAPALGQGSGTLQVTARVLDAAPAWQAVQTANLWASTASPSSAPQTGLLTIHVSPAAVDTARLTRPQVVLTIDYLHN